VELVYQAFRGCPLTCVTIPRGVDLKCDFGAECHIEFISLPEGQAEERKECNISDFVIDLSEYERVEAVDGHVQVELWRNRSSGEEVAVKSFLLGENHQRVQEIFMQEVQALMVLKHLCLLSFKGCCLRSGNEGPKLITEFLGCGSLKPILGSGSNSPRWWTTSRRVNCISGIVLGMKSVHSKGVIHRELKPENILLDDDRRVRIADFGSSRIYEADVTMTGTNCTPLYMGPEIDRGH
jgi:serine/threonine protein kinase